MTNEEKQAYIDAYWRKMDDEQVTGEEITDYEHALSTQLWYELHPDEQYWREDAPNLTPTDIWGYNTAEEIGKQK